jgi:uncharacterized membrane protein YkoI
MKRHTIATLITVLFIATPAFAADMHKGSMETCMKAALAKHPGDVISLEGEIENGKPIYEFDIKGKDGKEWEVECDAKSGKVTEEEQEVADANDAAFKAKAKVTQDDAKKTALAKFAGDVVESEFSLESDGTTSYEFDIKTKDGKEMEVEVDATTGKITETEEETFQIGVD